MLTPGIFRFPAQGNEISGGSAWGGNGENQFRKGVMRWIEQQATESWRPADRDTRALAAFDFMTVYIKPAPVPAPSHLEVGEGEYRAQLIQTGQPSSSTDAGEGSGPGRGRRQYYRSRRYIRARPDIVPPPYLTQR